MGNKIKYNIKNVHAAKLTVTVVDGVTTYSYATPQPIPGAVSIALDAEGESSPFYADGIVYFRSATNIASSYSPRKMRDVIRSMARNICAPINMSTVAKDANVADATVATYTSILESLHILDDIKAWSPKLRSKTEIRLGSKRNFVDPSLVVAALHATTENLLDDLNTFGLIFESMCLRDLKVYAESLGGEVLYYRDKNGIEC
ncbi:MAG: DUF4143 domain-containing protein [Eubacteriales bacterium]|nr:DUF4143 domain-containing protein [Eubacteriales bacterium]